MSTAATVNSIDSSQKRWYQLCAVAAFALGIGYIAIFPLYARVGAPPSGGEAWLAYLPGKLGAWWAIVALSVFTDLLYIPVTLGLYLVLKRISRNAMLVACAFIGLFVVLDLSVTWSHYASILIIFRDYSASTVDTQRLAYLAAADYAAALLTSRMEVVYAIVTLSFGILVASLVMLKGHFGRMTAWLGLATGISGIAALSGLSAATIGNALFATVWLFFVGYQLWRAR